MSKPKYILFFVLWSFIMYVVLTEDKIFGAEKLECPGCGYEQSFQIVLESPYLKKTEAQWRCSFCQRWVWSETKPYQCNYCGTWK